MGGGAWTKTDYINYSCSTRGIDASTINMDTGSYTVRSHQDIFKRLV